MMRVIRVIPVLAILTVAGGCPAFRASIRYDDLDQLVHRATGKHLYDPLTEGDFCLMTEKAWGADLGDLVRITEESQRMVKGEEFNASLDAASLTPAQRKQVRANMEIAVYRVLNPITDARLAKARTDMMGCNAGAAPAE